MSEAPPPTDPRPAPDEVHLWLVRLDGPPERRVRLAALLSADELERAACYRLDLHAGRWSTTRGALRRILGHTLQLPPRALRFVAGPQGKPALSTPAGPLRFSVSHSGALALIAVAQDRELGVDLEACDGRPGRGAGLVEACFSPAEQAEYALLPAPERPRAVLRGWTRKEAYLKALGLGLTLPLASFDVALGAQAGSLLLATRPDPGEAARWTLLGLSDGPEHVAALAIAGHGVPRLRWLHFGEGGALDG